MRNFFFFFFFLVIIMGILLWERRFSRLREPLKKPCVHMIYTQGD